MSVGFYVADTGFRFELEGVGKFCVYREGICEACAGACASHGGQRVRVTRVYTCIHLHTRVHMHTRVCSRRDAARGVQSCNLDIKSASDRHSSHVSSSAAREFMRGQPTA